MKASDTTLQAFLGAPNQYIAFLETFPRRPAPRREV